MRWPPSPSTSRPRFPPLQSTPRHVGQRIPATSAAGLASASAPVIFASTGCMYRSRAASISSNVAHGCAPRQPTNAFPAPDKAALQSLPKLPSLTVSSFARLTYPPTAYPPVQKSDAHPSVSPSLPRTNNHVTFGAIPLGSLDDNSRAPCRDWGLAVGDPPSPAAVHRDHPAWTLRKTWARRSTGSSPVPSHGFV